MEKEDEIADDMKGEYKQEANIDGTQTPMVSAPDRSELATELDGPLSTEGGMDVDPNIAYGTLPECLLFPSEVPVFPNAIHQSWLNGQTTLRQAGQCIRAELEVAMLCLQKRLGKVHVNRINCAHRTYRAVSKCRPCMLLPTMVCVPPTQRGRR